MTRWIWTSSVAATVACVGVASAQAPGGATTAPEGEVLTIRTAGQPERRVQVVKSESMPDGNVVTDVRDLATGETFTLMNVHRPSPIRTAVGTTDDQSNVEPPPFRPSLYPNTAGTAGTTGYVPLPERVNTYTDAPKPALPPGPIGRVAGAMFGKPDDAYSENAPRPIFGGFAGRPQVFANGNMTGRANRFPGTSTSGATIYPTVVAQDAPQTAVPLPLAKSRTEDPLIRSAARATGTPTPAQLARTAAPVNLPNQTSPSGKLFATAATQATRPRVGVMPQDFPPVITNSPSGVPTKVLPSVADADKASVTKVANIDAPVLKIAPPIMSQVVSPVIAPELAPIVAAAPITIVAPAATAAPVAIVAPSLTTQFPTTPQTLLELEPIARTAAASIAAPLPPNDPPAAPPAAIPTTTYAEAETVAEAELSDSAAVREIQALVKSIQSNPRPSRRMSAAIELAENKYAAKEVVIGLLVYTAQHDAVGVVRGQCIKLLTAMNYREPEYVKLISTWADTSDEPAVKLACNAALGR